jgi:uncharacterized protein YdhG (YjbR/CyaY superfamily)
MPATKFNTVQEYIDSLTPIRKDIVQRIRLSLISNLDKNFEETISYNMIGFVVPFTLFPEGYHTNHSEPLPYINLASQKQAISLYCMCGYDQKFEAMVATDFAKAKLKLDMGKSCIRLKEKDFLKDEKTYLDIIQKIARYMTATEWLQFYKQSIQRKK